jgi:hypothetical protein
MYSIEKCRLPDNALLKTYELNGAFTDCYTTVIPNTASHSQYVQAFYTTPVFKLERAILAWLVAKPASDAQATLLADGKTNTFSAWTVENRCENQLLLCDFQKRTRSWLMIKHEEGKNGIQTRLYFGSAVVSNKNKKTGSASLGLVFHALSGFHKIYSVVLLRSAKSRLMKIKTIY